MLLEDSTVAGEELSPHTDTNNISEKWKLLCKRSRRLALIVPDINSTLDIADVELLKLFLVPGER